MRINASQFVVVVRSPANDPTAEAAAICYDCGGGEGCCKLTPDRAGQDVIHLGWSVFDLVPRTLKSHFASFPHRLHNTSITSIERPEWNRFMNSCVIHLLCVKWTCLL